MWNIMIAIGERDPKYVILHFVCPLRRCARLALSGYKLCILTRSSTPRYTNVICMSVYSHMTLTYIKATRARTHNIYKRNRCFSFFFLIYHEIDIWFFTKVKLISGQIFFSERLPPVLTDNIRLYMVAMGMIFFWHQS